MVGTSGAGSRRRSIVIAVAVLTLSTAFVFVSAPRGFTALATCGGLEATITGTPGDDVLVGTAGDDVIVGLDGNDIIKGKGGNDTLCGDAGKDEIIGGGGADVIFGGKGADTIKAGKGADTVKGNGGGDWIEGGGAGDTISGGGGADAISGGSGGDTLKGNGGADTLVGGSGNDSASGGSGTDACKAETETTCEGNPIDFDLERFLINQSVPAADSDPAGSVAAVEVVAKRAGLARAFVAANQSGSGITPKVKLYWRDNTGEGSVLLDGPANVKKNPQQGDLGDTFNYLFDNTFLRTSTEIYVEVDPGQKILEGKENNNRYPSSGWLDLKAVNQGALSVDFVPVTVDGGPVPSFTKNGMFEFAERIFPVSKKELTKRDPYAYVQQIPNDCAGNWVDLLNELTSLWFSEGQPGVAFAGIVDQNPGGPFCGIGGIAWLSANQPVSVQLKTPNAIFAHELGHNLGLLHAPCGGPAGVDPSYPYPSADIGIFGWDIDKERQYAPGTIYKDIMSYCPPNYWISDHNYQIVVENRDLYGFSPAPVGADEVVVAFTGTIEGGNHAKADPNSASASIRLAATVDTPPRHPAPGPYSLVGLDASGEVVAVVSFGTHIAETHHGEAFVEGFGFSVPMKRSQADRVVEWQVRRGARTLDAAAAD